MDRSQILTCIFSFSTIFISTIFTINSLALYQTPRIPESEEEIELAKSLHEQIFKNDLDEFIRILNNHPEYTTIVYYYSEYKDLLTPLHFAAVLGRDDFIDELLKRNVDPSLKTPYKENTVLHISPIPRIIKRFIDLGLYIEEPNKHLETPLLAQLHRKHEVNSQVIHVLLEAEANPNAQTNAFGQTPLHLLFKAHHRKLNQIEIIFILKDLLAHGAKIDIRNKNGTIPLHFAASNNNREAIKIFIDEAERKGIVDIVNITNFKLNTPLFSAYESRSRQAFTALLRREASPLLKNGSLLSVNGEAHRKTESSSLFSRFALREIKKYFRPSDKCIQELIRKQEASAYASN